MKKLTLLLIMCFGVLINTNAQQNALDFDGDNDYVDCGNDMSLAISSSITVEAFIKADQFDDCGIVCKQGSGDGDYFLSMSCGTANDNQVTFGIHGMGCGPVSEQLDLDKWYHVAGVFDAAADKVYMYINGTLHNSQDYTGSIPTSTGHLTIGAYAGTTNYLFNGTIDEVRIWNVARTQAQIQDNMYGELSDPTGKANLVAYYKFNEENGITADNAQGTAALDGTLNNMTDADWVTSTAPVPFVTIGDGNWESNDIWNTGQNTPRYSWSRVKIKHNDTLNSNIEVIEIVIDTNAIFTISSGFTLTVTR